MGDTANNSLLVHLKVLVVVRIDAETGDEAVHHELHVGVLAASPPPEGFGWVEQQSLMGRGDHFRSVKSTCQLTNCVDYCNYY